MPVGPFPSFQACETHFAQDPDVDDPGAMCAYIENRSKEDDIQDGDKIIYGLDVQLMSLVDTPAVGDSVFLKSKKLNELDAKGRKMKCKSASSKTGQGMFLKSEYDDENYVVKAAALVPDKVDQNGEALSAREIYKAAVKFMDYQKVDSQHDFVDGKGKVIFNWIIDEPKSYPLKDGGVKEYPAGTWFVGVKIMDPKEWDKIKSGERKGFSIAGYWSAIEVKRTPEAKEGEPEPESKSKSNSEPKELKTQEVKNMSELTKEEIQTIIRSELDSYQKTQAEAESQKKAEAESEKLKSDLAEALKTVEELKKQLEAKNAEPAPAEETKEEEEDKPEDEEDKKQEDEEEKPEDEEETKEEEFKSIQEKALEEVVRRTTKGKAGPKDKTGKGMSIKSVIQNYKSELKGGLSD